MTEIKNPFSPSFARVPEIFIDREDLVKETSEPPLPTHTLRGRGGSQLFQIENKNNMT